MSHSPYPALPDEPHGRHMAEPPLERERLRPRGLLPPMASVALAVGVIAGLSGLGLGFRLGQWSTPSHVPASPTSFEVVAPTVPPPDDLQPASVSVRLQQAYLGSASSQWAVCQLEVNVVCTPLTASVSRTPAWHHSITVRNDDAVPSDRPAIRGGRLALAARLGDGDVTGSLIFLEPSPNQLHSRGLQPLDPDGSGIYYFDLGELRWGTYALIVSYLPRAQIGAASPVVESYLTGFAVNRT
jgi:hypothetical protein